MGERANLVEIYGPDSGDPLMDIIKGRLGEWDFVGDGEMPDFVLITGGVPPDTLATIEKYNVELPPSVKIIVSTRFPGLLNPRILGIRGQERILVLDAHRNNAVKSIVLLDKFLQK